MRTDDGLVLSIDLDHRTTTTIGSLTDFSAVLGGRGLSQSLLAELLVPGTDPFDPECPLVLGAGLLCGTDAPGAARLSIDSINPFTGGIASSNVGGTAAASLRRAGIAGLTIAGRSPSLITIEIDEGQVTIHDTAELCGKSVPDLDRILRRRFGSDVSTIVVGPAGERRAWPATVVVDGARTAGRCGLGAVLGSKSVKAIVVRGSGIIQVAEPQRFYRALADARAKLERSPFNQRRMRYGVYCYETPWEVESPYRNFCGAAIPLSKNVDLHPDRFLPYLVDRIGCGTCPIRCWTRHEIRDDDGALWSCEGLQGNDPDNFGARLDLDDPRDVLRAHALCNELGLDVDVASSAIAWAIDCHSSGLLSRVEADGRDLRWGDAELVFDLLGAIARREGLGDLLAEGTVRAAARLGRGSEQFSRHVRGNDLFECLWMSPAWAFGTVLAPRGGTHTRGAVLEDRLGNLPVAVAQSWYGIDHVPERGAWEDVERLVIRQEQANALWDALGLCLFTSSGCPDMLVPDDVAEWVSAALGSPAGATDLLRIGERIQTQERSINRLLGLPGRSGDQPPAHFVDVPLANRYRIDPDRWNAALDRYYTARGWDIDTGWPTSTTLRQLGLSELSARLEALVAVQDKEEP